MKLLSIFILVIAFAACTPRNEPQAFICPENPHVITTKDTLLLTNCSKNYNRQRWDMPNGAVINQDQVLFTSTSKGTYIIKLTVGNDDWANDYITTATVVVN